MKIKFKHLILKFFFSCLVLLMCACGSNSGKNGSEFIPPFVDPNGGPVLIIDVGGSATAKKSKVNLFQKTHTNSVKVYKLDGTLIGAAVAIENDLWQIQVKDNSAVIIKAETKNNQGGFFTLENLLPVTNSGTIIVNSESTKIVYLAWLNAFLQSKKLDEIADISGLATNSSSDATSLEDFSYLKKLIDSILSSRTTIEQVDATTNYVRKLLAAYATLKKINEFLDQVESGALLKSIASSKSGMFDTGGLLELQVITTNLNITNLKPFIDKVTSTLIKLSIISGSIKIDTIPASIATQTVSLALSTLNVSNMQAFNTVANTPPIFTSTPVTAALVGQNYSYLPTATDADGDTLTITSTVKPTWLTFNGTTLSGSPSITDVGTSSVTLSLTDNKISTAITQSFVITITATGTSNSAPVITSTPITTATAKILYKYTLTASDADKDTLTFSIITKPTWLTFTASSGILTGTPTATNVGDHNVVLQVSDGAKTAQQIFTITVIAAPTNIPPVFTAVATLTAVEGVLFSKKIVATDADNDTVTLASKTLPSWLIFDAVTGILSGTPRSTDPITNTVTITATDGKVTTPVELTFTIKLSTVPAITSNPVKSVIAGQVYQYNIKASDRDGDTVILSAPTLPTWLTLAASSSLLSGAPTNAEIGTYNVVLSATDNKSVTTGKQSYVVQVLNNVFIAKVNGIEVTDKEIIKYTSVNTSLSIKERNTGSNLTFKIKLDDTELVLTNNATSIVLTANTQTIEFIATDSASVKTSSKVTLNADTDHTVDISIAGGTILDDGYRQIPGSITFTSKFHGISNDPILSKTIQLDDLPQSLDSAGAYILDPLTITSGTHKIKATISYTDTSNNSQTASTTIDFKLFKNSKPTQIVKLDSLVINSDTNYSIHQGAIITITTSAHADAEKDPITKGLIINNILNENLTSYTTTLNAGETKTIKTFLKDPYNESDAYTISLSASTTNGGIPISLSATGTKLSSTTVYRDKVEGVANKVTVTAALGVDSENDGVKLIEWLVNTVVVPNENTNKLILDLSTYGGTTVVVMARVTDAFTASPAITTATLSLVVDLDNTPTFISATVNNVAIALNAAISVDHSSNLNKVYAPIATDPEGDSFTYQYKLNGITTTGSSVTVPFSTLTGTTLTVNVIQANTVVGTNTHNIIANNVVPTPIIIGNTTHVDINGNYSLIVRPGTDIEGDTLITTVTLNGVPIAGVVVNNEIQYSVNLTLLGGTTATFVATNSDGIATPISTTFLVSVIQALAPSGLSAQRGNTSVTLTWNSVNTATSYNLYYGTAINITTGSTKVATITSPYTLTGLTNGTTYYFRIDANHVSQIGPLSNTDIPMTPHTFGDTLAVTVNAQVFNYKFIAPGSFIMGALSTETGFVLGEDPQHVVTISTEYWMLQSEVTQAQWSAIMTGHPSISATPSFSVGATLPVEKVSWTDIMGSTGFIDRLHLADVNTTLTTGLYKLPTEAQWEYANRATTTTRFHWGDDASLTSIGTYAWYSGNAVGTNIVGSKTANTWGLFDMSGNVSEWCLDKTPSAYTSAAVTDPQGATTGNERVYRGGSWFDSGNNCRAAKRYSASKDIVGTNLGFRIIRVPLPTE